MKFFDHISLFYSQNKKNVSEEFVDKIKHILYSVKFYLNCAVYEIMWKDVVDRGSPQTIIWRMRFICWITKTTNTHSEYVLLIAFPP
jgi:hypothetical protein